MKLLRVAFVLLLVAAATALAWRARDGLRVETDLASLAAPASERALCDVARGTAHQGRLLFEGPSAEAVQAAADAFCTNLPQRRVDVTSTLRGLAGHTAGLLSEETRALLRAGRTAEVANAAAARLFGPVPPLFSVKDDPFLLATDYVTALQTTLTPGWSLEGGRPVCARGDRHYALVALDGTETAETVNALRGRAEAYAENDVRIWCSGPIFHTARATARATAEINVLSVISLVLVAGLGYALFRSLRFIPQLLGAVGAAFLVAAGALFAAFPRPHVLTFVFGTTLIGLAVDYVYHARMAGSAWRVARPLACALATTLACFAPLLFSELAALRQMALFTMAGLVTVCAAVFAGRGRDARDNGDGIALKNREPHKEDGRLYVSLCSLGLKVVLFGAAALGLTRLEVSTNPAAFYHPDAYLAEGEKRVLALTPDAHAQVAVTMGDTLEESLAREEAAGLRGLSALVPSRARQQENAALIATLYAREGARYAQLTGLRVPSAPQGGFLDVADLEGGGLQRVAAAFRLGETGLVAPCAADFVSCDPKVVVFAPRATLERLFAQLFRSTLALLGASLAVLVALLLAVFRRRVLLYAAPMVASVAATGGMLGWLGLPLTSFTLLCFFVMVGLGLDYVIFHRGSPAPGTRRTVLASFLSSLAGFGLLAFTEFPVTRAMGVTFAFGLLFAYVFSLRRP